MTLFPISPLPPITTETLFIDYFFEKNDEKEGSSDITVER
jgi:hypothetical protein